MRPAPSVPGRGTARCLRSLSWKKRLWAELFAGAAPPGLVESGGGAAAACWAKGDAGESGCPESALWHGAARNCLGCHTGGARLGAGRGGQNFVLTGGELGETPLILILCSRGPREGSEEGEEPAAARGGFLLPRKRSVCPQLLNCLLHGCGEGCFIASRSCL